MGAWNTKASLSSLASHEVSPSVAGSDLVLSFAGNTQKGAAESVEMKWFEVLVESIDSLELGQTSRFESTIWPQIMAEAANLRAALSIRMQSYCAWASYCETAVGSELFQLSTLSIDQLGTLNHRTSRGGSFDVAYFAASIGVVGRILGLPGDAIWTEADLSEVPELDWVVELANERKLSERVTFAFAHDADLAVVGLLDDA